MKLLIIDEEFPFPLNTGKRIRSFNIANALGRWHEISYMAYGNVNSPEYDFFRLRNLNPIAVDPPDRRQSGAKFYLRLLKNLSSRYPYIVTSHYTDRFQLKLNEIIESNKIDCILCEWSPYAIFMRALNGPKKIIVAHNVESAIWLGYIANEKNPFKKLYIAIQASKVARFERECFHWADGATAVSRQDAALLSRHSPGYKIEVIENGVDTEYFAPRDAGVDKDMLVFTGSMDWRPNQDAAVYFAREIFPLIRLKQPTVKAYFVGRSPDRRAQELSKITNFFVTGTVDDVRPYIARAGAYIVPLRIGGGSRLKILEAMSMRKAVISTSVGAEGLRVKDGDNILIRDDPAKFADAVISCLEDESLAGRIASQGRETVMAHYRWERLARKLSDYLCKVCRSK
jgi:sugar transferase (PEP-CTERM/EpsH1 system associated)